MLHDWLCAELAAAYRAGRQPAVNARDTDGLFRRVMREAGVGPVTRALMWAGVRWGALTSPSRRAGWWADAPAVAGLSVLVLGAAATIWWAAHETADAVARWLGW